MENGKLYVLDERLNPVPVGAPGELCVGGAGVGRGYYNRQQLTEEKFIPNPFGPAGRIYKTGDKVRWLENGDLQFFGKSMLLVQQESQHCLVSATYTVVLILALATSGFPITLN